MLFLDFPGRRQTVGILSQRRFCFLCSFDESFFTFRVNVESIRLSTYEAAFSLR